MKLLVAAFLCFAFAIVHSELIHEMKDKLQAASERCQLDPETAVDRDAMKKYIESKNQEPAPANLDAHDICVAKEMKWQKADGTVNKEYLKERIQLRVTNPANAQEALDECAVDKATELETSRHLLKCLVKHAKKN